MLDMIPQKIYEYYLNNKLSKVETAEKLIRIIENEGFISSFSAEVEVAINLLGKLDLLSDEVFNVLEKCLITGQSDARISSTKVLMELFPEKSLESLLWVVKNDCPPDRLYALYDLIGWSENPLFESIQKELFKKIEFRVQKLVNEQGILFEEAIILALFEQFVQDFTNLNEYPKARGIPGAYFKIGEEGRIISLVISTSDEFHIEFIPVNIYRLTHLEEFAMYRCCLRKVPESIGRLNSLRVLQLAFNFLTNLPRSISALEKLEVLKLNYNNFKVFPESIGSLKSLKQLDLGSNNIEMLPESIGSLKALKEMDLSDNNIKALPESIGSLKLLRKMNLNYNDIKNIPENIGSLTSLYSLSIDHNEISEIPRSIGDLKSLKFLFLSNNNISKIPNSVCDIPTLRFLGLQKNKIRKIPKCVKCKVII